MVSKNTNPPEVFHLDPTTGMALPSPGAFSSPTDGSTTSQLEDPSKKVRKPYTITKSRESWTEPEHDKFLEALQLSSAWGGDQVSTRKVLPGAVIKCLLAIYQVTGFLEPWKRTVRVRLPTAGPSTDLLWREPCALGTAFCSGFCFDRDWKKIEAFVGSKTVIQIRSHAQKYFLKVQKNGTNEHLPPPRPKRKAAHPYPQKAPKIAPLVSQEFSSFQASPAIPDAGIVGGTDPSPLLNNPDAACVPAWTDKPLYSTSFSHVNGGDARCAVQSLPNIYPCGSNEITPRMRPTVLPDFAQVYSFIGSVFDPNETGHLHKLKKMDPIDIETVLLLMRNLSINLASPDFEDHRRLLSSYEIEPEKDNAFDATSPVLVGQSEGAA
ncbi:hypothetical protein OROGR_011036 [Orobanche gracilis]